MSIDIEKNNEFKYTTLEAMKHIKENHSLIFESVEDFEKGKNTLKYCEYGVYSGSGIVNVYDNCIHLQPNIDKEFLEIEWVLISTETKEKLCVSNEFATKQIKEKDVLKDMVKEGIKIYDTFEAFEFLKDNPSMEMELLENKNHCRTRLRFQKDKIVKDYNRSAYEQPELTNKFLNNYWKVGIKKEINFSGKNDSNIVAIMEDEKIIFIQENGEIDILKYAVALKDNFEEYLKDIVPNKIEIRKETTQNENKDKYSLYSNGTSILSLSPRMTNWAHISFSLSKEDVKGLMEYIKTNNDNKQIREKVV